MQKLTFLLSRFLDGGIDTVLVRYLQNLDYGRWRVQLLIGTEHAGNEVFLDQLPSQVEVAHLVGEGRLTRLATKKVYSPLSWWEKPLEGLVLEPVRRLVQRRKLAEYCADSDVVVDFDARQYSLLGGVRAPKVGFFHFNITRYCGGKSSRIKRLERKFVVYDRVVMICDAMLSEGRRLWPSLADRLVRLYNPVDVQLILSRSYEVPPPEGPYIVSVCRLSESQKDVGTLLRAYALLVNGDTDGAMPKLLIVGKGPDEASLKALAGELGIADRVQWLGFQSNPMPYVRGAELLVLSSRFEGLATVLVEAQALGVVALSTDCPVGPAEVQENGSSGMLVPVGDVEALSSGMRRCLSDEELRGRYKRRMPESVRRFAAATVLPQFEALLDEVIAAGGCRNKSNAGV